MARKKGDSTSTILEALDGQAVKGYYLDNDPRSIKINLKSLLSG